MGTGAHCNICYCAVRSGSCRKSGCVGSDIIYLTRAQGRQRRDELSAKGARAEVESTVETVSPLPLLPPISNNIFQSTASGLKYFHFDGSIVCYVNRSSPDVQLLGRGTVCALDCEGVHLSAEGKLCLLQIAFLDGSIFLFDICDFTSPASSSASLTSSFDSLSMIHRIPPPPCLPKYLVQFLQDPKITKLVHDARNDAAALFHQHNISIQGVFDTQLCYEFCELGTTFASLDMVLDKFHPNKTSHPLKKWAKKQMLLDPEMWMKRPLGGKLIEYAAHDVRLLVDCEPSIRKFLLQNQPEQKCPVDAWSLLKQASEERCRDVEKKSSQGRHMCFSQPNHILASQELADALHKSQGLKVERPQKLRVDTDFKQLLALIPTHFQTVLCDAAPLFSLRDVILDLGRRPAAFFGSKRDFLAEESVTAQDIQKVVDGLGHGKFGPDNRAGINGCLHRISAIKNKVDNVIGLTLRVGRSVRGNADMILDLVMATFDPLKNKLPPSILVLGVPGTGKTTIVREIARLLAEIYNVCVVDTSNEICGDGDVPHPSIGFARRMMVPKIDEQSQVMIECLQNHTPDVILIDEIGRRPEVDAARTVKQRGVRLVASAHGDLRGLVKNHLLNGLVGGVETVTLGDAAAKGNHGSKLQAQRQGEPVFDAVVELQRDDLNSWRVVKDVAGAVDNILAGKSYNAQNRTREENGGLRVQLCKVGNVP